MVVEKLKFWCQSVLPLVYDNSLSYYEVLCKVVERLNEEQEQINEIVNEEERLENEVVNVKNKIAKLEEYVENYFDNLDVSEEVESVLNKMYKNGDFNTIFAEVVGVYSTPVFVDRMNDMKDTKRIYVLSGNRHIYQAVNGLFFDTGVEYGKSETINLNYHASSGGNQVITQIGVNFNA